MAPAQVAPEIQKLETAVTFFLEAPREDVWSALHALLPVNKALFMVLGSGYLVDAQASLVGNQVIRLLEELGGLQQFSGTIAEQLFYGREFSLDNPRHKDQFMKALRHHTAELSPEVQSWVAKMARLSPSASGGLAKLLRVCAPPILDMKAKKRRREDEAAASIGGQPRLDGAPPAGKAPKKI